MKAYVDAQDTNFNDSMKSYVDANSGEPTWIANWSAYNTTWSNKTNLSYMLNTGDNVSGNYTFDITTFHIDSSAGRVGIGTASPDQLLHIFSPDFNDDTGIRISNQYSTGNWEILRRGSWTGDSDNALTFEYDSDPKLIIQKTSGNVGINTSVPNSTLYVVGNLTATDTIWWDSTNVSAYNSTMKAYVDAVAVDTNETARFNNLTGYDCGGTDKVVGVQAN
jgi:hypothetical protein